MKYEDVAKLKSTYSPRQIKRDRMKSIIKVGLLLGVVVGMAIMFIWDIIYADEIKKVIQILWEN